MKTKEQLQRRKEIKQAKRDWKDTIRLNPTGFQQERLKLQALAIDLKGKSKTYHSLETSSYQKELVNEFEGKPQRSNYTFEQYRGNYNLGYSCQLIITN